MNHSHGVNVTPHFKVRLNIACYTDIDAPAAVNSPVNDDVSITDKDYIIENKRK